MKKLKLHHDLARLVEEGKKTTTWRLFDDKDLSVNDVVELIDKVDPDKPQTWRVIGMATIRKVIEKRLGDVAPEDMSEAQEFVSPEAMLATFRKYYGENVEMGTMVKMIWFDFQPLGAAGVHQKASTAAPQATHVKIYADGGSRGNPGPSASGYVIFDDQDNLLAKKGVYLGVTTNNQAEYTALRSALEEAEKMRAAEVDVYMDSLLVINQMKGSFKVRNRDLWPLHEAVKQLCTHFKRISFTQVPRELNKLADAAVNQALDAQAGVHLVH